jgi:hypothetical protein
METSNAATSCSDFLVLVERGDFRTPLSTLQTERAEGGWGLVDVEAKCRMIFITRLLTLSNGRTAATAHWIRYWGGEERMRNPPNRPNTPTELEYLCVFFRDLPYIETHKRMETVQAFRRRTYVAMLLLYREGKDLPSMRIVQQEPDKDWNRIWSNLHVLRADEALTASWYTVIHDLLPTRERLRKINLAETNLCTECGRIDTRIHRVIECGGRKRIWIWTKQRLAWILRTTPARIPEDWVVWPQFVIWPETRRKAGAWFLIHLIYYYGQGKRRLTLSDYCDFLRRARWKEERKRRYTESFARYLTVLDWQGS